MTITDERSERTQEQGPTSHKRLIIGGVVLLGFGATGLYLAGWTSLMGVNSIEVDGAKSTGTEQLISTAGITEGTPMMRVDVRAATSRLADLPQLASVDVRRVWPRTVVLSVTERQAVAVQQAQDGWDLIDENGIAFAVTSSKPKNLPVLERSEDEVANTEMIRAVTGLSPKILAKIASVSASSPNSIQFILRKSGAVVNWGSADESEYKSSVLAVLLSTDAGWYDVSNPDTPTTAEAPPAVPAAPTDPQSSVSPSIAPSTQSPTPVPSAATPSPAASGPAVAESPVGVVPSSD